MPIALKPLPYPYDALEPYVSRATVETHYEKHHRGYVEKANALIAGSDYAHATPEEIILATAGRKQPTILFNNAAQSWNHSFYWNSMTPSGGGEPPERVGRAIERSFGSFGHFRSAFAKCAGEHFGSGWIWLVQDGSVLKVVATRNADNPLVRDKRPLLVLDVWEHAYYLDYRNRRSDYVVSFLDSLVNWAFVEANMKDANSSRIAAEQRA